MSLIQQPFAFDHSDVQAAQELIAHPVFGPLLFKVLLHKEQVLLGDISAFASMPDKGIEIARCSGYHQALKDFWPSLQVLAKRDLAKEQAAAEKRTRRPRREK